MTSTLEDLPDLNTLKPIYENHKMAFTEKLTKTFLIRACTQKDFKAELELNEQPLNITSLYKTIADIEKLFIDLAPALIISQKVDNQLNEQIEKAKAEEQKLNKELENLQVEFESHKVRREKELDEEKVLLDIYNLINEKVDEVDENELKVLNDDINKAEVELAELEDLYSEKEGGDLILESELEKVISEENEIFKEILGVEIDKVESYRGGFKFGVKVLGKVFDVVCLNRQVMVYVEEGKKRKEVDVSGCELLEVMCRLRAYVNEKND